jgi:hypothetical protein
MTSLAQHRTVEIDIRADGPTIDMSVVWYVT